MHARQKEGRCEPPGPSGGRRAQIAPDWESTWAVARYDIGLSEREFFELLPRHFEALCDRFLRDREHGEVLFAQLAAAVINSGMCRPKEPVKPELFMPSRWGRSEEAAILPRKRMTRKRREQVASDLRAVMATYLKKD